MFAIVGTVPNENFPLTCGPVTLSGRKLIIENQTVDINRGTPALLATAVQVCEFFDAQPPVAYLIGDIGRGAGSRKLYAYLEKTLPGREYDGLTFHYIQPDVDWHNRVLFAVSEMSERPVLIADAGFMYAAKMSGQADAYDVFTPDIGELAFLADESAPHPFYTRGFIFHEENRVSELIAKAYQYSNAARYLLVKGEQDILADATGILKIVSEPMIPSLEAIGGTGDIITGLVAALTGMGKDVQAACIYSSIISRMVGEMAEPDPGTQVIDIIKQIPESLKRFYSENHLNL
ncbi:MAG: sugar kinase [Desulfobacteraceae bacterium]|nr:sugar kinase [Desulfobacteraceae bacterium]MBC2755003.1 sugar kinase [Desulfobacteraceae bacterium]